jgi:hypothetical protein
MTSPKKANAIPVSFSTRLTSPTRSGSTVMARVPEEIIHNGLNLNASAKRETMVISLEKTGATPRLMLELSHQPGALVDI